MVANANPVHVGLPASAVVGRFIDVPSFATFGGALTISAVGASKLGADVGGSARHAANEGNFCVVWSEEAGPGDHDVRYKVLAPDGFPLTGSVNVDSSAADDVTPAIAKTLGGGVAPYLAWTLVWVRDTDGDGDGFLFARRIAYGGAPGAGNFFFDLGGNCAHPVVSARLDQPVDGSTEYPAIVAFKRLRPSVSVDQGDAYVALVERHMPVATTTLPETPVRLTTQRDGDVQDPTELGAALWTRVHPGNGFGFGSVSGFMFRHRAALVFGPQPVGRQYCDAQPSSVDQSGGRRSSRLRILGNQSSGSLHTAECIDMPGNAFAYLIASQATGNVLFPGGSQGRLCISGSIGRYVDQIVSSGAFGSVSVTIDPSILPQQRPDRGRAR